MVLADFGGDFLSIKNSKDGDTATITGKPEYGTLTFQGKEKKVVNMEIEVDNKKLTYTPPNKAGNTLVEAWGDEMDNWVGKKFTILHVEDKMVVRPVVEEKSSA